MARPQLTLPQKQQLKPGPFCGYTLHTWGWRQKSSHSLASALKNYLFIKTLSFMSFYHVPFLISHAHLSPSKGSWAAKYLLRVGCCSGISDVKVQRNARGYETKTRWFSVMVKPGRTTFKSIKTIQLTTHRSSSLAALIHTPVVTGMWTAEEAGS